MNLLLDTTIQIDRVTASKQRKKEIEKVLLGNGLYCSTYVLGEYYNNIVTNLLTLYSLFFIDQDIVETGKRINEQMFGRDQARVSKLYANILDMCAFRAEEIDDAFQLYIDVIQDEFYRNIHIVFDSTKCPRADREIEYEDGAPVLNAVSCRKDQEICSICAFWKRREKEINAIIKNDVVDEKIKRILEQAKENDREYRGKKNCSILGDTIISMEAFENDPQCFVCSSNKKDFQPICDLLGIKLIALDYSWKKKEL